MSILKADLKAEVLQSNYLKWFNEVDLGIGVLNAE